MTFEGYDLVYKENPRIRGKQRISCLIRHGIGHQVKQLDCQVANLGIIVGKWQFFGVYREWCIESNKDSRKIQQQKDRYEEFVRC